MAFDVNELKLAGIEEKNIDTIHEYENYLKKILPFSEDIRDMYIDVDVDEVLTDAYFFCDNLMIEIPDFITFYNGRFHAKKMHFVIHPIKDAIVFLEMEIAETKNSRPDSIRVKFRLKNGAAFSFSGRGENAQKLESVAKMFLVSNFENG